MEYKKVETEGRISEKLPTEQKRGVGEETRYEGNYLFYDGEENRVVGAGGGFLQGNFLVHT